MVDSWRQDPPYRAEKVELPLSANGLSKIVNGISDSLLMNAVRVWDATGLIDGKKKRISMTWR
jgi:hypothetical protein